MNTVKECFVSAKKDEKKGRKHKGLIVTTRSVREAENYLEKARRNLLLCSLYLEKGFDYKIPEEWYYTLYYCALAILSKFGIVSRSQKCTAAFIRYAKDHGLIEFDDDFIDRITVHSSIGERSDVDEREAARYSSSITSEEVREKFAVMEEMCKRAISQCEEIVFSKKRFEVPNELMD